LIGNRRTGNHGTADQRDAVKTIVVMQPYFIPYAGYFRLFAASDLFVILDCVQFPRRGWVHRNRLIDREGNLQWLTLPLEKGPQQTTLIRDLRFRDDTGAVMLEQSSRFPLFDAPSPAMRDIVHTILQPAGSVVDHIVMLLGKACTTLALPFNVIRSSELNIDPALHGWQKIAAIAKQLGAEAYLNSPGGVDLYNPSDFQSMGLNLKLLAPYEGSSASILQRLHTDGAQAVRDEILHNITLLPA
jgi:hypothetical protein